MNQPLNPGSLPLADLQVFARVVEQRSFAAAARQLALTTSAVSRSVGRLEARLGVKLLLRTTRSLSLTEVGAEVHAACGQMLQGAELAVSRAAAHRQQPQGVVRISAPAVFGDCWLAPLLPGFCARWPQVRVQMQLSDTMADLSAQRLDLAIRIALPQALPPALVARPLVPVRYLLVAQPAYLQAGRAIDEPADLQAHSCMSLGYGAFQDGVDLVPAASPQAVPVRLRLNTPITIASSLGMLQALLQPTPAGIALMADFVAQPYLDSGQLVQVLPDWQLAGSYGPRMAYAVFAPGPLIPPKLRALLDYLHEQAGGRLSP